MADCFPGGGTIGPSVMILMNVCGNGYIELPEKCDDGIVDSFPPNPPGVGCRSDCMGANLGYHCVS